MLNLLIKGAAWFKMWSFDYIYGSPLNYLLTDANYRIKPSLNTHFHAPTKNHVTIEGGDDLFTTDLSIVTVRKRVHTFSASPS